MPEPEIEQTLAGAGDVLSEDPWCRYEPGRYNRDERLRPGQGSSPFELSWEGEARERLKMVPAFVRRMVEKGWRSTLGPEALTQYPSRY